MSVRLTIRVDAAILRTALRAELFELDQIRSAEWDPMHHNPGNGLYALVSRGLRAVGRAVAPPDAASARGPAAYLDAARERLGVMSVLFTWIPPRHSSTARCGSLTTRSRRQSPSTLCWRPQCRDRPSPRSGHRTQGMAGQPAPTRWTTIRG